MVRPAPSAMREAKPPGILTAVARALVIAVSLEEEHAPASRSSTGAAAAVSEDRIP